MKRGTWVAIAAVVLVIASPFVLTAPLPSGSIGEVRDRFELQGYETVSEGRVEPRRLVCLGDNACPSVHVLWTFASPFTTKELQTWLDDAGYTGTVEGDCATESCRARGTADGWNFLVLASRSFPDAGRVDLSLSLKE